MEGLKGPEGMKDAANPSQTKRQSTVGTTYYSIPLNTFVDINL